MRLYPVLLLFLALSGQTALAQTTPPNDELANLLVEKGLLTRIGEVGGKVSAQASDLVVSAMGFLGVPYRRGGNSAPGGSPTPVA